MAQVVGYWDDDVTLEEGPFVICNPLGNGWRIECEVKGSKCPCLPDISIYKLRERLFGDSSKMNRREEAEKVCDVLNQMVKDGQIILHRHVYVAVSNFRISQ